MTLALALSVLDTLLLWAVIASRRGWWSVKALALVVVVVVNVLALHAYTTADGWPSTAAIPPGSEFTGCVVVEPNPVTRRGGVIYIWAIPAPQRPLIGYRSTPGAPRAYAEPYSRGLHQRCLDARKVLAAGIAVGVGYPGQRPVPGHYVFYRLPPAAVPHKEDNR